MSCEARWLIKQAMTLAKKPAMTLSVGCGLSGGVNRIDRYAGFFTTASSIGGDCKHAAIFLHPLAGASKDP